MSKWRNRRRAIATRRVLTGEPGVELVCDERGDPWVIVWRLPAPGTWNSVAALRFAVRFLRRVSEVANINGDGKFGETTAYVCSVYECALEVQKR